jgi:hypothetical protein
MGYYRPTERRRDYGVAVALLAGLVLLLVALVSRS